MKLFCISICLVYALIFKPTCTTCWSWPSFLKQMVSDSYDDCLTSHSTFTSNYKEYCDSGKQLIEECDFDEDFNCGNEETFKRKRRDSIASDGIEFFKDFVNRKKDDVVDDVKDGLRRGERWLEDNLNKIKHYFFSSKAYKDNCNDKLKEYFGTYKTDSKREYIVKIVCKNDTIKSKAYIKEIKTEGCIYKPKSLRNKTGECPVIKKIDKKLCLKLKEINNSCAYDYACKEPTQKCCLNNCDHKVCLEAINIPRSILFSSNLTTTKQAITTTTPKNEPEYICGTKGKFRSWGNCLLKRKQCYHNKNCKNLNEKCCPTSCGNECLPVTIKN